MPSKVYVNFFCNDGDDDDDYYGDDDDDDDDDDDESYEKSSDQSVKTHTPPVFIVQKKLFYEQSTMKRLQFDIK